MRNYRPPFRSPHPMHTPKFMAFVSAAALVLIPTAAHPQDAPRLTVMTFQSPEHALGAKAADALRDRLAHDLSRKQLDVVPTDLVQSALQESSFPPDDPLDPANEAMLARVLQAQYYVTGTITSTGTGYQVTPRLVLTRDATLAQPLPTSVGKNVAATVAPVSRAVRDALKQMAAEQQCRAAIHDNAPQRAIAAAHAGITAYPQATLARLCALDAYWGALYPHATSRTDSLQYADSILALAQTIVALDSASAEALRAQVALYPVVGDSAHARRALIALAHAEPDNTTLVNQVINSLMAVHDTSDATRLAGELLAKSPDDPHALRTAFSVYVHTHQWSLATTVGPRLIKLDTAAADTSYFMRMAAAYQGEDQPQQGIAMLQQGTAKFTGNATLWLLYAQALRQAGETTSATTALRRAVALNPRLSVAQLQLADAYMTDHHPDSAYAALQQAASAADADKSLVAQTALSQGARLYQDAKGPTSRADYQEAQRFLQLANQLHPSTDAQFLNAAASFAVMQRAVQEAGPTKSCALARLAEHSIANIQPGLTAGANDPKYQASASQMTQALPQFRAAITGQVKKLCH